MSEKEKKVPEKAEIAPAKKGPVKVDRAIRPRKPTPSTSVLATFDDLLDNFRQSFRESFWTPWDWAIAPYQPYEVEFPVRATYADLVDEGTKFLVRAEAPGIPRDKIDVTVTKDGIEISGETGAEMKEKGKSYVVRERTYSSLYKNLAFPEEVIPEKAECSLKNGILEVSIPKKTPVPIECRLAAPAPVATTSGTTIGANMTPRLPPTV